MGNKHQWAWRGWGVRRGIWLVYALYKVYLLARSDGSFLTLENSNLLLIDRELITVSLASFIIQNTGFYERGGCSQGESIWDQGVVNCEFHNSYQCEL